MPRTGPRRVSLHAVALAAAAVALAGGFGGPAPRAAWALPAPAEAVSPEASHSAAGKIERIRAAYETGGSFGTIELTENEANSYLAYDLAYAIPAGVSEIVLAFQPGRVRGTSMVDFDKLKQGLRAPPNPIADLLLRGVHSIGAEGSVSGRNGVGQFHLERVLLDGVELPQMIVDYMIEQYIQPRYPDAAINRPFLLPFSIDSFRTGTGLMVLTGKK